MTPWRRDDRDNDRRYELDHVVNNGKQERDRLEDEAIRIGLDALRRKNPRSALRPRSRSSTQTRQVTGARAGVTLRE